MGIELLLAFGKAAAVLTIVMTFAAILTWVERKESALIQDRIGVNRAKILGFQPMGLFHIITDAVKMVMKEEYVPRAAYRFYHSLAPAIAMFPALVALAVVPFGEPIRLASGRVIPLQVADLDMGILFVIALTSVGIYGVAIAGWCSGNKFSLLGAVRATAQVFSYEIAMGLALVSILMVYGSFRMDAIVEAQRGYFLGIVPKWGIFTQPIAFLIFFTAAIAETKRIPFDLPEGESELVAGYFTEYSGMKWGMFFLGEFAQIAVVSVILSVLFLGGYHVPFVETEVSALAWWLRAPIQIAVVLAKTSFFIWLQVLIRWTLPRFRYDQLMSLGWKKLIPLGLANIFVTGAALLALSPGTAG